MPTTFGGDVRFSPRHAYAPRTEAEVLAILDRHARGHVRVGGALHSWNPGVASDDAYIDLRHFDSVAVERTAGGVWATVGGGCRIKHVLRKLHAWGDATLPSIGLITEQSVAGAISTATHGSGRNSLSHFMAEVRVAAYDPITGKARAFTWTDGDELRAARCAVGCMGVVLAVRFRCIPKYDVAETIAACDTLDDVLAGEPEWPLQQFYLLPHRGTYFAQRHKILPPGPRSWGATLYRAWWYFGIDVGLHLALKALVALNRTRLTRFFFRRILPPLIVKNRTVVDRGERMLVMEHELFRHHEIELFVPASRLREAAEFVRVALDVFAGTRTDLPPDFPFRGELLAHRGTFTFHYPVTFRRVLPDDALISTSAGPEPVYAISFITLAEPRGAFYALGRFLAASMLHLFAARPHWGKWFPLSAADVERLYPSLPAFREVCRRTDPRGVFRGGFAGRTLFGEGALG
jgi:FAD/FMN-containing dehydrogenase